MEIIFIFAFIGVIWFFRSFKIERKPRSNHSPAQPTVLSGPAYVEDGDSIIIKKKKIRLFGIDAPELNHPHGVKAKWALVALCKGQCVTAEIIGVDHFGRNVAKCSLNNGDDLSLEMVKRGLALDWPKFSGGCYAQYETSDARKKLWLADARQKGRMDVWARHDEWQKARKTR